MKSDLDIPWEVIRSKYNYAAMDEDGSIYVYEKPPVVLDGDDCWGNTDDYNDAQYIGMLKIPIPTVPWDKSLVSRWDKK